MIISREMMAVQKGASPLLKITNFCNKRVLLGMVVIFTCSAQFNEKSEPKKDFYLQPKTIQNLARAFLSKDIFIGVFEFPALSPSQNLLYPLRSGIIPEMEDGYKVIADNIGLVKLRLIRTIKGNFDNIVFLPIPEFEPLTDPPLEKGPEPPVLIGGSKWILMLKSGFDPNNIAKNAWVEALIKAGKETYINKETVFLLAFVQKTGLCLRWPDNVKPLPYIEMVPENYVENLLTIQKTLSLPEEQKRSKELDNLLKQWEIDSNLKMLIENLISPPENSLR